VRVLLSALDTGISTKVIFSSVGVAVLTTLLVNFTQNRPVI
jgi:hypothetical protein